MGTDYIIIKDNIISCIPEKNTFYNGRFTGHVQPNRSPRSIKSHKHLQHEEYEASGRSAAVAYCIPANWRERAKHRAIGALDSETHRPCLIKLILRNAQMAHTRDRETRAHSFLLNSRASVRQTLTLADRGVYGARAHARVSLCNFSAREWRRERAGFSSAL